LIFDLIVAGMTNFALHLLVIDINCVSVLPHRPLYGLEKFATAHMSHQQFEEENGQRFHKSMRLHCLNGKGVQG
jgi:hypothetical protein